MLVQEVILNPKLTYGFTVSSTDLEEWKDFDNPVYLYSCTIPNTMNAVYKRLLSKNFFMNFIAHLEMKK